MSSRKKRRLNLDSLVERMKQKAQVVDGDSEVTAGDSDDAVVGGCRLCDTSYRLESQLLAHVVAHYPDAFFLRRAQTDDPEPPFQSPSPQSPLPVVSSTNTASSDSCLPNLTTILQSQTCGKLPACPSEQTPVALECSTVPTLVTEERPLRAVELLYYMCAECCSTFTRQDDFNEHKRTHHNAQHQSPMQHDQDSERAAENDVCVATVNRSSKSREFNRICGCCEMEFTSATRCNAHMLLAHGVATARNGNDAISLTERLLTDFNPYECQRCNVAFPCQQQLIDHLQNFHQIAIKPLFVVPPGKPNSTREDGPNSGSSDRSDQSQNSLQSPPTKLSTHNSSLPVSILGNELSKSLENSVSEIVDMPTATTGAEVVPLPPCTHSLSNDYLNDIISSFSRRNGNHPRRNRAKKNYRRPKGASTGQLNTKSLLQRQKQCLPAKASIIGRTNFSAQMLGAPSTDGPLKRELDIDPATIDTVTKSVENNEYWRSLIDDNVSQPNRPKPVHWVRKC